MDFASDLMALLPQRTMSQFSIHLEFVEDWATMSAPFVKALQQSGHLFVRQVGDTFVVLPSKVSAGPNPKIMKFWLLMTVQDKRLEVRFHHPPGTFAGNNMRSILAELEEGIRKTVHDVNTYRLLQRTDKERVASVYLLAETEDDVKERLANSGTVSAWAIIPWICRVTVPRSRRGCVLCRPSWCLFPAARGERQVAV